MCRHSTGMRNIWSAYQPLGISATVTSDLDLLAMGARAADPKAVMQKIKSRLDIATNYVRADRFRGEVTTEGRSRRKAARVGGFGKVSYRINWSPGYGPGTKAHKIGVQKRAISYSGNRPAHPDLTDEAWVLMIEEITEFIILGAGVRL